MDIYFCNKDCVKLLRQGTQHTTTEAQNTTGSPESMWSSSPQVARCQVSSSQRAGCQFVIVSHLSNFFQHCISQNEGVLLVPIYKTFGFVPMSNELNELDWPLNQSCLCQDYSYTASFNTHFVTTFTCIYINSTHITEVIFLSFYNPWDTSSTFQDFFSILWSLWCWVSWEWTQCCSRKHDEAQREAARARKSSPMRDLTLESPLARGRVLRRSARMLGSPLGSADGMARTDRRSLPPLFRLVVLLLPTGAHTFEAVATKRWVLWAVWGGQGDGWCVRAGEKQEGERGIEEFREAGRNKSEGKVREKWRKKGRKQ